MDRLATALVCFLAILTYVVAKKDAETKLSIIKRESLLAASAIRNITIRTPECKVQLASMGTDLVLACDYVVYAINNVIPSTVADEATHKLLVGTSQAINSLENEIEQVLFGESEQLKEKMAVMMEKANEATTYFEQNFKEGSNVFVNTQIRSKHDFTLYGIYKLKIRATLFEKRNEELKKEMTDSITRLVDAIKALSVFNKNTGDELRHIMLHMTALIERNVYSLENWVEVNTNNTEGVKIAKEVVESLSQVYNKLNSDVSIDHTSQYLKFQLIRILESGLKQIIRLADVEVENNLGGQEFIRSSLFDVITMGRVYSNNIKSILLVA